MVTFIDDVLNVVGGVIYFLSSYTTLQNTINIIFSLIHMNCTRTIYEIDPFGQCDILPYFCLSWDWCSLTYFFLLQCVNNRRFSHIWIAHKPDTNIFLISVEDIKLPK